MVGIRKILLIDAVGSKLLQSKTVVESIDYIL